jgi:hypothetical protein
VASRACSYAAAMQRLMEKAAMPSLASQKKSKILDSKKIENYRGALEARENLDASQKSSGDTKPIVLTR